MADLKQEAPIGTLEKTEEKPAEIKAPVKGNEDDILLYSDDEETEETSEDESEEESKETEKPKEPEEEDEEEIEIPRDRPTIKEIKAEFPEIFQKFPQLKEAYFRELEFTKIFPSIEDAKEAITDNQAFQNISDSVLSGNPDPILEGIEKTDPKSFQLFALSFLPALYKRNREVYDEAVTPLFEGLVRQLVKSNNEDLKTTGENVAQFLFGDDGEKIIKGMTFSRFKSLQEEHSKNKETKDIATAKAFQETYTYVEQEVDKGLKAIILRDFDPNKTFPKFVRQQLVDEVVKRVKVQLSQDAAHRNVMSSRWKHAKDNGYSADEKSKIVSTFLARAKSLVPSVSAKVRTLAAGSAQRSAEDKLKKLQPAKRELPLGKSAKVNGAEPIKKEDLRKMTDLQILDMD